MSTARTHEAAKADAGAATNVLSWLAVPLVISLLIGGATAWQSMFQSLWIDELHTAWVSSGPRDQVVPRAAVGNQTPVYFAWQWWLGRTFGQSEACLRLTSLIAWFGSLALLAVVIGGLVRRSSHGSLWWLVCLAALDRQQIFFATEARPYMLMSLAILLGWLILDYCLVVKAMSVSTIMAWLAWVGCCVAAMWLQPTAILFVAAHIAWAIWRGGPRWSTQISITVAVAMSIAMVWPMRYVLEPAWQGRQAWAAFAANLHWQNVLEQLPIAVVGVPGLIAWVVSWWPGAVHKSKEENYRFGLGYFNWSTMAGQSYELYLFAWALPLVMVVVLTAFGIAPLMHARYLFAATIPLTLWAATMLARLVSRRIVTALVVAMLLMQSVQQGSLSAWLAGRLPVVERGENWREALDHVQRESVKDPGPVQIYCASNLIEGSRSDYLDGGTLREEYLSMPLRSLYGVSDRAQIISLLNDPRGWSTVISSREEVGATRWLLVRVSASALAKRLQLSGLRPLEQIDFGGLQLVRF